nr:hypothetical protein Q903MT_gene2684 [Picea sitchensis]
MSLPLLLVGKQVIIQPGLQAFEQALLAFSPNISIYSTDAGWGCAKMVRSACCF